MLAGKEDEARLMGAERFINSHDPEALEEVANSFGMILSTANMYPKVQIFAVWLDKCEIGHP
jgi:D-arabinose 1-dehydrogenase-like Zn-dependent alcohol dehydrogenase